jgi:hypothetical protein
VQFRLRGKDETLSTGGACFEMASGLRCVVGSGGALRGSAWFDPDGGGVDVVPRARVAMMHLDRIRFFNTVLTGGKDDRVFRLDRVDDAACAIDDTAWEEDFRRCQVKKRVPQGTVTIGAREMVELNINWNDGANLDEVAAANMSVQIDNTPLLYPKPLKYAIDDGMVYGFELGSFNAILPTLSRGKRLQISFPRKPQRSVDLNIGDDAGRKAVAFLKKCVKFKSCVADRGLPGKAKHCYLPRLDLDLR